MLWDVLIAIGIGLSQLALAWYAVHISVKENRKRNAVIIGIVGVLGISLTVFATVRTGMTQKDLEARLEKIQKNTETPPQVTVNVPQSAPPQIIVNPLRNTSRRISAGFVQFARMPEFIDGGRIAQGVPITANLFLMNRGSEPVDNFKRVFGVALVPVKDKDANQADREVHSAFSKSVLKSSKMDNQQGTTLNVGDIAWNTLSTPALTKEQVDQLLNGGLRFYVYGWARWKDGLHDFDSCLWLQSPSVPQIDSNTAVWHVCSN
jgi:hypothetical protein